MVAEKFIQNVKVISEKRVFTEDDMKIIMSCIQEAALLSPVELMSLLDNLEILIEEGRQEISSDDYEQLREELLETVGVD